MKKNLISGQNMKKIIKSSELTKGRREQLSDETWGKLEKSIEEQGTWCHFFQKHSQGIEEVRGQYLH